MNCSVKLRLANMSDLKTRIVAVIQTGCLNFAVCRGRCQTFFRHFVCNR
jgi:hypothetical protein